MGAQPLYGLTMSVGPRDRHGAQDSESETFGIRTITTRLIGASPIAPHGSRQFLVNGRPILFRGGGWSENLFLHYSAADTANQIALIKNLGLNGIRTEGKEMPGDFYEQMDRAGILVDAGFQCCDAWQLPDNGKGVTADDYRVLANSALAIGRRLRNHPSILNFSWSDNNPDPAPGGGLDRRLQARRLPGAAHRLRRVQERSRAPVLRGEGGPVRLGPALLLVRHHPLRPRTTAAGPTSAAPGPLTQRPARAPPSPRSTRSTASSRPSSRPSSGRRLTTTSTTSTTSRICPGRPTAGTRSGPCTTSIGR